MAPTVGIVLISHSAELANGLAALVGELGSRPVTVVPAGGTDQGGIGTSYAKVRAAITRADSGAGALVLADLGSAVLTGRLVAEDEPELKVLLADAPFVEGAVAARAAAGAGAALAAVRDAAEEARTFTKL